MRVNKRLLNKRVALVFRFRDRRTNACSYLVRSALVALRASRVMSNRERPTCAPGVVQGANRIWSVNGSSGDVRRFGLAFSPRDHGPYQVFAMAKACQRDAAYMEKDQQQ